MSNAGWNRDNNSCHQQVVHLLCCSIFDYFYLISALTIINMNCAKYYVMQIDRLKKRFDAMQAASKKIGSALYFEPLRVELNDCFGALKDVSPDMVFSNRKGLDGGSIENAEGNASNENVVNNSTQSVDEPSTSAKKKPTKSKYLS